MVNLTFCDTNQPRAGGTRGARLGTLGGELGHCPPRLEPVGHLLMVTEAEAKVEPQHRSATYMIARAAYRAGVELWQGGVVNEFKE
jgi:hypothetical protein